MIYIVANTSPSVTICLFSFPTTAFPRFSTLNPSPISNFNLARCN